MYGPPPDSDTESDEFDFYIKQDDTVKNDNFLPSIHQDQINDLLYEAVKHGHMPKMIELWEAHYQFNPIDMPLRQGWSLLLYACYYGHLGIVEYLLNKEADVNKQIDSVTPLLLGCDCENPNVALEIVQLLLKSGAFINVCDRHGTTPLMNSIKRGYVDVVNLIIKHASLEAKNRYGNTAIFIAVEKNSEELVEILMKQGADINTTNNYGFTPKQIAENLGYENIVALFPEEEEVYNTPANYRCYSYYEDLAPTVFHNHQFPDYFQEIEPILHGMNMEKFLNNFSKANITLEEFLTINDEQLENIGIKYPFQRNKIHLGLFKY